MADINTMITEVQAKSQKIRKELQDLINEYEELYRVSNRTFMEERSAANGSMQGFEEFYRMVQTIRRNRDTIGSMLRGLQMLRPLAEFKIVEEEMPEVTPPKQPEPKIQQAPEQVVGAIGDIDG